MSKKTLIFSVLAVLAVAGSWWLLSSSSQDEAAGDPINSNGAATTETQDNVFSKQYVEYDSAQLANEYSRHIIFFHASWCPECRAFEQALLSNQLPDDVQILKADYDSSTQLKQKYGVTIQSTFVEVDDDGELIAKWVGYGEDKSFTAVDNGLNESQ